MKKFLGCLLLSTVFNLSYGQVKIGLRFGGAVSTARIDAMSDTLSISKDENVVRPMFGLTLDFPIKENVGFSTGLSYAPKRIAIDYQGQGDFSGTESYRLQYLQLPILIRFSTNEIMPGFKVYFTTGFTSEIKVFDEANSREAFLVESFQPIDISFNIGSGIEYSIGPDTILYGGLTYFRGLINSVKDAVASDADLKIRNDLIGLELGVRF